MYWSDFHAVPGSGPWQGLDVTLEPADSRPGGPAFRVEAAPGRIRIALGGEPLLWARIHRQYRGLWRLLSGRASSLAIVPPIRAADVADIADIADVADVAGVTNAPGSTAWWRAWARLFARELARSPHTPLFPGRWGLTPARASDVASVPFPGNSPVYWSVFDRIEGTRAALESPLLGWESWWLNGSGALLRTRERSPEGDGRVRALRKQARAGVLPPVLAYFISGLDMYAILDGHDRLLAATLEGAPLAFLVLWQVRARPRPIDPERQAAVLREIERKRGLREPRRERPLERSAENNLLVDAFDTRDWLFPVTRAYPIRGGARLWEEEIARRGSVPRDHALFTGEAPEA